MTDEEQTIASTASATEGTCGNCGHNVDVHDEEDGQCRITLRFRSGYTCGCEGFERRVRIGHPGDGEGK